MQYIVTTSTKEKYTITESEAQNIAKGELKGLVYVPSIKGYINLSFVVSVTSAVVHAEANQIEGILHDGTRVIKKFGQWVDAVNPSLKLDPSYYPELASDEIMTEYEYKELNDTKQLKSGDNSGSNVLTNSKQ